jgi:hypothetical protein
VLCRAARMIALVTVRARTEFANVLNLDGLVLRVMS